METRDMRRVFEETLIPVIEGCRALSDEDFKLFLSALAAVDRQDWITILQEYGRPSDPDIKDMYEKAIELKCLQ